MPAPITDPNPNQVRSHQVRQRFMSFSLCFRSSAISLASSERLIRRHDFGIPDTVVDLTLKIKTKMGCLYTLPLSLQRA
ncbi:hypothetical protein QQP08_008348 [Theobroma cacao]|nr:hypothetical protein QQP08_008348 [Theobroma cacao]